MSGSTGSGDLTAGDDGSSLCCSTEDGPSERFEVRKVHKIMGGNGYPFAVQVKRQVVLQIHIGQKNYERKLLPFCCTGEKSGGFAGVFNF